jgi:Uma2 family endonuclease
MSRAELYEETLVVPRAVRFPVELIPPPGFDPERSETWPVVDGRLEYVDGRLLYMPPCGEMQQFTVADTVGILLAWVRLHPDFLLGTNEAGMRLGEATRGADAAVWRRDSIGAVGKGFARVPPVLAVEVAGAENEETAQSLREKSKWYHDQGVRTVWIVLPESREVLVITSAGECRYRLGEALRPDPSLPDLAPMVEEFFVQLRGEHDAG